MKRLVILLNLVFLLIASNSYSDDFTRKTTWVTSDLITASKLNADPDETARVLGTSSNGLISNGNIKSTAAIIESKITFDATSGHDHDGISSNSLGNSTVASAQITDGTIVNADVNASADIVSSKIAFSVSGWDIDGTTVTSSATELNLLTGVTGTVVTESTSLGGLLSGTLPNPGTGTYFKAAQYFEPDQTCVLALAGYSFDPATATTFKDSSVYGNDFAIVSTPPEGVGKVSKTCVDLDGTVDTLSIADGNYGDFGDCDNITIEYWLKHVGTTTHYIWENGSGIGSARIDADNKITVILNVGTGAATITSGAAYVPIADFYYIVVTYQLTDNTLRLFVNGVADGTDATKSGDVDAASGDIFYIGSDGGTSDFFTGKIDGFRILRRDMLVAEALARYNAFN